MYFTNLLYLTQTKMAAGWQEVSLFFLKVLKNLLTVTERQRKHISTVRIQEFYFCSSTQSKVELTQFSELESGFKGEIVWRLSRRWGSYTDDLQTSKQLKLMLDASTNVCLWFTKNQFRKQQKTLMSKMYISHQTSDCHKHLRHHRVSLFKDLL